jgi:hypothetical protein
LACAAASRQMSPMFQAELSAANISELAALVLPDLARTGPVAKKHKSAATGHNHGDNLARLG